MTEVRYERKGNHYKQHLEKDRRRSTKIARHQDYNSVIPSMQPLFLLIHLQITLAIQYPHDT